MKNYDQSIKINQNPNWPYIPNHPYRTLMNGGSKSGQSIPKFNKKSINRY